MAKKTRKFKTEVQQLLHLVIHSLYSKKEIFLRELISNASDAIDRARVESLTDKSLQKADDEWKIKLIPDSEAGTLTVSDNGVGMTQEEVEKNIGTIANSGTRAYLEQLGEGASEHPELIGQFGVGFYSAFMVADKVTVETRRAGGDEPAIRWASTGEGNYTLEEIEKPDSGTDIILHLSEDQKEFLEEHRLRQIVKSYSDYIAFPVVMDVTRTEKKEEEDGKEEDVEVTKEETLNSRVAIWKKSKSDVTDEEYAEFYKHVSHDFNQPLETIHYAAEGTTEFKALLFIPAQPPFDMLMQQQRDQYGPQLYVRNVQIMEHCSELLPEYLRFVKGVVDSSDLPLNVSREMLQDDAIIRRMRKSVVGKILGALKDIKEKRPDEFKSFFDGFGRVLKEGLHFDYENREKLLEVIVFHTTSTKEGERITLKDYKDRMPEGQKEIYYLTGDNLDTLRSSPYLEAFEEKGYEVILMADPIDEWVVQATPAFDETPLKAIDKGEINLDGEEKKEDEEDELGELGKAIQSHLDEDISTVRSSRRLKNTASVLVHDEHAMNANMERIMRAMNQDVPASKKILELNPDHPAVQAMKAMQEAGEEDKLKDHMDLLYGQALLAAGAELKNPARFCKLVSNLMVGSES